jgi:hypothetical protein
MHQKCVTSLLSSSFSLRAELTTTLDRVSERVSCLAEAARRVSEGARLVFDIDSRPGSESRLVLGKDEVVYTFYFEHPGAANYSRNLVVFLSILSLVREDYRFDACGLFPYMLEALRWSVPIPAQNAKEGKEREIISSLSVSNCRLASSAVGSWSKAAELEKMLSAYTELTDELIEKLCGAKPTPQNAAACTAKLRQLGISGTLVDALAWRDGKGRVV